MSENLGTLFGSEARVKIIRLFIFNADEAYDIDDVSMKSKVAKAVARKEVGVLLRSGLIKKRIFYKTIEKKVRGKVQEVKKKTAGYILNSDFLHLSGLKQLLITTKSLERDNLIKRLSKAGKLTLVAVSGVFIQNPESRVDLLIVGNNMNRATLTSSIRALEAEIGRELAYAFFETPDYQYRLGMYDKLIRDILDYPHEVLLNKLD